MGSAASPSRRGGFLPRRQELGLQSTSLNTQLSADSWPSRKRPRLARSPVLAGAGNGRRVDGAATWREARCEEPPSDDAWRRSGCASAGRRKASKALAQMQATRQAGFSGRPGPPETPGCSRPPEPAARPYAGGPRQGASRNRTRSQRNPRKSLDKLNKWGPAPPPRTWPRPWPKRPASSRPYVGIRGKAPSSPAGDLGPGGRRADGKIPRSDLEAGGRAAQDHRRNVITRSPRGRPGSKQLEATTTSSSRP